MDIHNIVWFSLTAWLQVNHAKKADAETTFITIIHLAEKRVIAKADVAAKLPGTVGIYGQKCLFHGHRPNSPSSRYPLQASPPHSIELTHILKYILKHTSQSLSKGPIQNILLTLLHQEPSFLRQRTLVTGICVHGLCACVKRGYPCIHA